MIYWIAHVLLALLSKIFFPIKVSRAENIPTDGGMIIASNHLSNLDPMILGLASGRKLSYVAKDSLFKNKAFSFILYQVGAFPIRRDSGDVGAIKEALRRLRNGGRLVIFPEGTRKSEGSEKKVQPGIAFLTVKSNCWVVPAFIKGSDKVLPPGAKFIRPGRIDVAFGKAVKYTSSDSYPQIAVQIKQKIDELSFVSPR